MSITVCKFGGSSVSDAGMFVRVNRIIRSDPARRYIILSAPGKRCTGDEKITDLFYHAHGANSREYSSILAQIFLRYAAIRDALAPKFDLEGEFSHIREYLHTSIDYAASRGEYLCAKLFAAYAGLPFVDAAELLFFNEDGSINFVKSQIAVCEKLLPVGMAVIPGFYGVRPDGSILTFSRGGSDVSGALISAMISADLYENWTDVDGLYTADPNIVKRPKRNRQISFSQMEQIARCGAQLLHPDALLPLRGTHIDTILKNTFSPGAPGTRISEDYSETVRCVTGKRTLYMLHDESSQNETCPLLHTLPLLGSTPISSINVFGMDSAGISMVREILNPIHIIHMQDHIQIIMPEKEYETAIRAVHAILMNETLKTPAL